MARRVTIWLTDEEASRLETKAEALGLRGFDVATIATCLVLGVEVPTKNKKRQEWVRDHELRTRGEYYTSGPTTIHRVLDFLTEAGRPMSTQEIRDKLHWKKAGSLNELLRESSLISQVEPPKNREKKRGRPPFYWALAEEVDAAPD